MLKKKILGAKVLDTNGYVQATRLITPTNNESEAAEIKSLFNQGSSKPSHQLGDIYNANMVDIVTKSILQKAIIGMQSSSYDKNTNTLTQTFVRGDGTTLEYTINLGDVVDSNDIENSDSTTMQYNNGKISTSVNTIGVDDVDALFNN